MVHSNGEIHRDLKPANVFLINEGDEVMPYVVRLGDFGLSRDVKSKSLKSMTKIVGTWMYQAPERINNQRYGMSSDIWALGVILMEMITGNRVFKVKSSIKNCTLPPFPTWLNPNSVKLIHSLLCVNPSIRPTTTELKKWIETGDMELLREESRKIPQEEEKIPCELIQDE